MNENEEKKDEQKPNEAEAEQKADENGTKSVGNQSEPQNSDNQSGTDESKAIEEAKKAWKTEENARFAKMRRENEELTRKLQLYESERRENISDKTLEALGFTRDDLKDEENLAVAKAYVKAVANGEENPKATAYEESYRNKKKAQREEQEKKANADKIKAETDKKVEDDIKAFKEAFPNENIADLVKSDSDFMKSCGSLVKDGNVTEIYKVYRALKGLDNKNSETKKSVSTPFASGSNTNAKSGKELTQEEILKLPTKEYEAYMSKWKGKITR